MFVPSHVFAMANVPLPEKKPEAEANLYVVVAGKLYADTAPVKAKILPVLGSSATSLIYAYCRADASNLYGQARAVGMKYHLTAVPASFKMLDTSVDFDQKRMQELFDEGLCQGAAGSGGPAWRSGPPAVSPGDGDFIRNGTRLKRVELDR
jgi:hypothetical protein